MSVTALADQAHRALALDTGSSFIVQAPAGSGKTELLTLRYLSLLAQVEQPEEILAITFTKKAASEMRDRIVLALRWAEDHIVNNTLPEESFQRERLAIASAVLQRNEELQWHLLENPTRLRVQTIDSFCFYLASQLPVLSRIGGDINISEDVSLCFNDAITNTLDLLESSEALAADIELLLTHLDNNKARLEALLTDLLINRDQWLTYVLEFGQSGELARQYLHDSLAGLVDEKLVTLTAALAPLATELTALLNFSTSNLIASEKIVWPDFVALDALPAPDWSAIRYWQRLADLLLTGSGEWRKPRGINVNCGFPTADTDGGQKTYFKDQKARIGELLESEALTTELQAQLQELRLLPADSFADGQWQVLEAVLRLLSRLSVELLLSFRRFRMLDYSQTSAAALLALGDSDNPTDIALALDNRLQHILVDEFQDTSRAQLQLLERLIAGWDGHDGRTLFLVGDAMQSCYSFRNANVGIYLDVRARGIGDFSLQALDLSANFRSQANIVHWVNRLFAQAFPAQSDSSRGAVPYSRAEPVHEPDPNLGIRINLISHGANDKELARDHEAERVIAHIRQLQQTAPGDSIAVLARSRPHFRRIIDALNRANLSWQATDIDRMAALPVIEDALSLTRALLDQADRLAWLSLLRAPWVGLTTAELLRVTTHAGDNSIWAALLDLRESDFAGFLAESQQRLQHFVDVMAFAVSVRYRRPLRQLLEGTWTLLAGIDCCSSDKEIDSIAHYFSLLEQHDKAGGLTNLHEFEETVRQSFVPNRQQEHDDAAVQLLTMHKAKGLEYDHVILPALGLGTAKDGTQLIRWHERLDSHGESRLFLAALTATGAADDPLYQLLKHEAKLKSEFESTRLLYIAVTRACKSALLLATLEEDPEADNPWGVRKPTDNSLLARIWQQLPLVAEDVAVLATPVNESDAQHGSSATPLSATRFLQLQPAPQISPVIAEDLQRQLQALQRSESDDVDSISTVNESVGVVADAAGIELHAAAEKDPLAVTRGNLIHSALEALVLDRDGFIQRLPALQDYWRAQLRSVCADENSLAAATDSVLEAVSKCQQDAANNWIFNHQLTDSACELRLCQPGKSSDSDTSSRQTTQGRAAIREFVVDRTFVDAQGVRWIIDYKSSTPGKDETLEEFKEQQQQRYARQLHNYRYLFSQIEDRAITTALYLTSVQQLVIIQPQ